MTPKLKVQIALLIIFSVFAGFASGVYATSVFIGNFVDLAR